MNNRFRAPSLPFITLLLALLVGCSKDPQVREFEISGQIFIVTKGRENVKLGLVGVHALSDEQLKTAVVAALGGKTTAPTADFVDRLFTHLPPPSAKTDADGQFNLKAKGKVWLLAREKRKVGNSDETYLWIVATEGDSGKLLLSNDTVLNTFTDLCATLARVPEVGEVFAKRAAAIKAEAEAKAAAEKRFAWTWAGMRRAGFAEEKITRTLTQGGTLVVWGSDKHGQTVAASGLSGVVAIAAGGLHTVALKGDGSLLVWGLNDENQSTVPLGLSGVVAIAAGFRHTVALKGDGTVVAWGSNKEGQTAVPVGLYGVVAIAAGDDHTVALKGDGTVVAWGSNKLLGANFAGQSVVPAGLTRVVAVTAGQAHTVALKDDGAVVAWGSDQFGQAKIPAGLPRVVAIAAGWGHTTALRGDGMVVEWGDNGEPSTIPGAVAVAAGGFRTVALKGDGTVVERSSGGTTVPDGIAGVVAIAAGASHTVALSLDLTPAQAISIAKKSAAQAEAANEAFAASQAKLAAQAKAAEEAKAAAAAKVTKSVVELQKRRAASGSAQAAFDLALRYTKGDGVPQDVAEAKRLLQQAVRNADTATLKQKAQAELDKL